MNTQHSAAVAATAALGLLTLALWNLATKGPATGSREEMPNA